MRLAFANTGLSSVDTDSYQPVSEASQAVSRRWAEERNYLKQTASDWVPLARAAFDEIRQHARSANWDGEGAAPVTAETISLADLVVQSLYSMLPKSTPPPDIIPEGDGEICLSWAPDDARVFSVSLGEHGVANFAAQLGRRGGRHGWLPIATTSRAALEESLREIAEHVDSIHRPVATARSGG